MKAKLKVIKNWEFEEFELTGTNQLPKLLTEAVRLVEKESQSAGAN